jgi:uncharacterized membrane protein YphA (DoxX/SURF4 family)
MQSIKQLKRVILVLFGMVFSNTAAAHVRWFVDGSDASAVPFEPYSLTELPVQVWLMLAVFMVGFSVFLDMKLPSMPLVDSRARQIIVSILRIFTGLSLILTSYDGCLIAPHFNTYGVFGFLMVTLQLGVGLMLIANWKVFHAGMLMLVLLLGAKIQFGVWQTIEYWNVAGIAFFLMLINPPRGVNRVHYMAYSVPALRIFTGIALVTLGLSEKLLSDGLGQAFIVKYNWNFMQNLGFEFFTDRLFILSAGIMEVVFGSILILGTVTRLNILVVALFMITTNLTFVLQNKPEAALMELVGHLPIIATAIICVFFGGGQKLKLTSLFTVNKAMSPRQAV